MRRVAAGEQFKKRIRSESKPNKLGVAPEWRRSFSESYSLTVKLGEWLECRRISFMRWTRKELASSGDGGSTTTDGLVWDFYAKNEVKERRLEIKYKCSLFWSNSFFFLEHSHQSFH